ncbi:ABC transporter substrate-binding protein [Saccharibacillus sp. CPCC 101409]|uniref:ABC transporter substrate-binding protein n=1 Tax=Saccharibacillus sp. CPCC 101409 TaxID=3058041 RepID=UPI00267414F7|nr:ABC transporter substrate-binding protein [Saccharibacillus sp. CPCC 101409]MDO3411769.1 ABC transporter substrate-binding protein [Saccharibacillus sp. CPCC 101409]
MKKAWMMGMAAVLVLAMLAGCGGGGSGASGGKTADGKTVLTLWGDWGGDGQAQIQTMLDAFNKSQDKIQVKYAVQQDVITKFLTSATNGQTPDIVFWDRWRTALYAPKNVLHSVDEYIERDGLNREDFYSEALKELTYQDKLYGLPLTVDTRALFYNKKMLAEAGMEPPKTWDDLETAAKAMTKWNGNKLTTAGMSLGDPGLFSMYIQQAGGSMLTEDNKVNVNTDAGKEVLNFWGRLMNEDKVYKVGFEEGLGEGADAFVTGKVAMLYTGPWMLSTYDKYGKDLEYGIVPPVTGPNGDKGGNMGGFGLVIPQGSKHPDEAWEFIKWWTANKDNALLWAKTSQNIPGFRPAVEDPYFSEDERWKPFLEALEFAKVRPTHPGYSVMEENALIPNLELFLQNKQSVDDTLQKAQTEGDKQLAENATVQ